MSVVYVGATNVGSMNLGFDKVNTIYNIYNYNIYILYDIMLMTTPYHIIHDG